jgi:tryptophan halogenase
MPKQSISQAFCRQCRIELGKLTGRVFKLCTGMFGETWWIQVMRGQGLLAEQYHPIVNTMDDEERRHQA